MSNLIIKRPENIFQLFSSLLNIDGVGEKKLKLLEKKIGPYIINLLFYLPIKSINRFQNTSLKKINHGEIITCEVEIIEVNIPNYNFKKRNNISKIFLVVNLEKNYEKRKSINMQIQIFKNIYLTLKEVFLYNVMQYNLSRHLQKLFSYS